LRQARHRDLLPLQGRTQGCAHRHWSCSARRAVALSSSGCDHLRCGTWRGGHGREAGHDGGLLCRAFLPLPSRPGGATDAGCTIGPSWSAACTTRRAPAVGRMVGSTGGHRRPRPPLPPRPHRSRWPGGCVTPPGCTRAPSDSPGRRRRSCHRLPTRAVGR
jgi:hypothetical protein